jgi:hypothetical protein
VDTSEGAPGGPKRGTRALTGVAMHCTSAIALIIPRPCVDTMADRGMGWMTALVALPRVGVQHRAASGDVFGEEGTARPRVGMVAHPPALLARLARDHTEDRGPIVGRGAVALAPMGASAWRVAGRTRGCAGFPPRAGPAHRPRRRCQPSPLSGPSP